MTTNDEDENMGNKTLTLEVPAEIDDQLEQLAERTRMSKSSLATQALSTYLEVADWHVEHIRKSMEAAKSGAPGVPHAKVKAWVKSWGTDKELPKPKS
jgi:predicted transcriptional regulator